MQYNLHLSRMFELRQMSKTGNKPFGVARRADTLSGSAAPLRMGVPSSCGLRAAMCSMRSAISLLLTTPAYA